MELIESGTKQNGLYKAMTKCPKDHLIFVFLFLMKRRKNKA